MHLNKFAIETLQDRYMAPQDKDVEDIFIRSITSYCKGSHKERMLSYVLNNLFVGSTPVLANAGTGRGNPIACFLSTVPDSRRGILGHYTETGWLASNGGGVGSYWGDLRTLGSSTSSGSQSNGMLPFQSVVDRLVVAFAQGSTRRASYAGFLPIWHPEIVEFMDMRKPTGGDINRKNLNLHHGVVIDDMFMTAVDNDYLWELRDPHSGKVLDVIPARRLWEQLLEARSLTGEPYIIHKDNMMRGRPETLKRLMVPVYSSNLCTEITVATEMPDGTPATGVCCLGSLNLDKWDEIKAIGVEQVVSDCLLYLWLVLDSFVNGGLEGAESARRNAAYYRDVGLGTIGFHSYLQQRNIPFNSPLAISTNLRIFKSIRAAADKANTELAHVVGPCQASTDAGLYLAFTHMLAIAPNASTSIFCDASPGIEPYTANGFVRKSASGTYVEKNKYLQAVLQSLGKDTEEVWTDIIINGGSVQHLEWLDEYTREVFKTAYELDQRWIIQHAADRQPFICQAQSVNLYFPPKTPRKVYQRVHKEAFEKGLKTLYYSKGLSSHKATTGTKARAIIQDVSESECLACAN